uniref:CBF1-interacting co-repressor CIR N-terminal domain-containing protein n=1 Tax=Spongospora subterranea TaxID=70186 RepID=A0A0H5R883_9EUKA|eukprot:CRZ10340.1 hypothetical protein [Spongospora subterranea]
MGKGGLSFLNKKSWHTATIANTEKVWLAEQKDVAEKAKLAQLQKEIAEERQVEELRALQRQHGIGKKPVERLDWMYRSAEIEAELHQKEKEDFLLGKEVSSATVMKEAPVPAVNISQPTAASGTEKWVQKYERRDLDAESRIREDPMLLILQQEQQQRLSIIKNPIQMKRIREEVNQKKLLKKLKKMEKADKKERKSKESEKNEDQVAPIDGFSSKYGLIQPRLDERSRDNGRRQSPRGQYSDRRRNSNSDDHRYESHRSNQYQPHRSYDQESSRRRRSRSPSHHRRSRSPRRNEFNRPRDHYERSSDGREGKSRNESEHVLDSRRRVPSSRENLSNHGATEVEDKPLSNGQNQDRRRHQRVRDVASSSGSRLTAEERAARLKAMLVDAQSQNDIRSIQLEADIAKQKEEEEALRLRNFDSSASASFIQDVKKKAFMESSDTVEDRIKQRAHYRQKGSTDLHSFT